MNIDTDHDRTITTAIKRLRVTAGAARHQALTDVGDFLALAITALTAGLPAGRLRVMVALLWRRATEARLEQSAAAAALSARSALAARLQWPAFSSPIDETAVLRELLSTANKRTESYMAALRHLGVEFAELDPETIAVRETILDGLVEREVMTVRGLTDALDIASSPADLDAHIDRLLAAGWVEILSTHDSRGPRSVLTLSSLGEECVSEVGAYVVALSTLLPMSGVLAIPAKLNAYTDKLGEPRKTPKRRSRGS